jgi:dihydroneopterin aldolase
MDLKKAGQSDDLQATIDYAEIALGVKQLVETKSYKLIEALAEAIAEHLLDAFPLTKQIQVRVTKPNPPVALAFAGVTVSITRKRER